MEKPRTPYAERADQKVKKFVRPSPQKSTLVAIAGHANPDGTNAWPGISTIALDSGHSIPTVKRHIKILVDRGDLTVVQGGKGPRDTNHYEIPCCRLTKAQLEEATQVASNQLKLPLVMTDQSVSILQKSLAGLNGCASEKQINLILEGYHPAPEAYHPDTLKGITVIPNLPLTSKRPSQDQPDAGSFVIITKKERTAMDRKLALDRREDRAPIEKSIADAIAPALHTMSSALDEPYDRVGDLRQRFWGKLTHEQAVQILEDPLLSSNTVLIAMAQGVVDQIPADRVSESL